MSGSVIRIGTRPSRLSQAQTRMVSDLIKHTIGSVPIEIVPIATRGDKAGMDRRQPGGAKGAFTSEIESRLLEGEIDMAVHSMKDLPNEDTDGLAIGAIPARGDPRDALLSKAGLALRHLPRGSRVGTGSLRRKAQLLKMRNDLRVVDVVGNVDTRIGKLASDYDALVLAVAGLERIGEAGRISQVFSVDEMVPAVCQGILAIEIREGDEELSTLLSRIDDRQTRLEASCERAFAKAVGVDCYVPVGCCARISRGSINAVGIIADQDGRMAVKRAARGPSEEAVRVGRRLGEELLEAGGSKILAGAAS